MAWIPTPSEPWIIFSTPSAVPSPTWPMLVSQPIPASDVFRQIYYFTCEAGTLSKVNWISDIGSFFHKPFLSFCTWLLPPSWDSCPKTRFCSRQPWETQSCTWIIYRDLCHVVLYEVLLCIYIFVALVFSIVCSQTCYDLIESFLKIEESLLVCSAVFH